MKNKDIKKIMKKVTRTIRDINKNIENDNLWLGRFCIVPIRIDGYRYDDRSGAWCKCYLAFIDKATGKQMLGIMEDTITIRADLYWLMNDFICEQVNVWAEVPSPRNNIKDYTKTNFVVKKRKVKDYNFNEILRINNI